MRRFLVALVCLGLCLSLCACGSSHTAVPELKLSWGMTREEILNAGEIQMEEIEILDDRYLRSKSGQKLPKVNGLEIHYFTCHFDKNGALVNVCVKFTSEDSSVVYDALKSKYGEPTVDGHFSCSWRLDDTIIIDSFNSPYNGCQGLVSYYEHDYLMGMVR